MPTDTNPILSLNELAGGICGKCHEALDCLSCRQRIDVRGDQDIREEMIIGYAVANYLLTSYRPPGYGRHHDDDRHVDRLHDHDDHRDAHHDAHHDDWTYNPIFEDDSLTEYVVELLEDTHASMAPREMINTMLGCVRTNRHILLTCESIDD